jgi:flagellar biosynthesis/type III secretory pathway ATPase
MCPYAAMYVSSCSYICVLILLYICPHTGIYASSCCYICVLVLAYMRPHAPVCVLVLLYVCLRSRVRHWLHAVASYTNVRNSVLISAPSTSSSFARIYVSVYCYICVLIHECAQQRPHTCLYRHTAIYVSSYYCMYVLILQYI